MTHPQARLFQAVRPLPGLWRADHCLQIGLDVQPLILEPVPPQIVGVLSALATPHTLDELAELNPDLSHAWLDWLLSRLVEADLVRPWRPQPHRPVVVWGSGPLAERVHAGLQRADLQPLPLGQRSWPTSAQPLIVLAAGTAEPDRCLTDRLTAIGQPTLMVRADAERGVIGPFVQPHCTPCLRCLDLTRADLDPHWPRLLAQLCRTHVAPAAVLLEWLAGEAVAEVSRWRAGELPDLAGRTLELTVAGSQRLSGSWPPHPACHCQARLSSERVGTLAG